MLLKAGLTSVRERLADTLQRLVHETAGDTHWERRTVRRKVSLAVTHGDNVERVVVHEI